MPILILFVSRIFLTVCLPICPHLTDLTPPPPHYPTAGQITLRVHESLEILLPSTSKHLLKIIKGTSTVKKLLINLIASSTSWADSCMSVVRANFVSNATNMRSRPNMQSTLVNALIFDSWIALNYDCTSLFLPWGICMMATVNPPATSCAKSSLTS